jgi:hypothetical protein
MADPSSVGALIVGAAIALVSVAITNATNLWIKRGERRHEEKKRRAEKFETLVETVYEYDHWLDVDRDITAHGQPGEIKMSPLAKIEAIAAVHFPQFSESVKALGRAGLGCQSWSLEAGQKRRAGGGVQEINDGYQVALEPYMLARNALLEELKKFAAKGL